MATAKKVQTKSAPQQQNITILVAIVAVALIGAAIVIFISRNGTSSSGNFNYDDITQGRTSDGGFVLGDPSAPITIVAFEDFLCPHCQEYAPTLDRFIEDFVVTGQAKFEYRFFPVITNGDYAAQLAECAEVEKPGSFWQAHDALFSLGSRGIRDERMGRELADTLDINYASLLQCVSDDATQYQTDTALGTRAGVQGTPAIRVRYGDSSGLQTIPGYDRGAPPFNVLQAQVLGANVSSGQ